MIWPTWQLWLFWLAVVFAVSARTATITPIQIDGPAASPVCIGPECPTIDGENTIEGGEFCLNGVDCAGQNGSPIQPITFRFTDFTYTCFGTDPNGICDIESTTQYYGQYILPTPLPGSTGFEVTVDGTGTPGATFGVTLVVCTSTPEMRNGQTVSGLFQPGCSWTGNVLTTGVVDQRPIQVAVVGSDGNVRGSYGPFTFALPSISYVEVDFAPQGVFPADGSFVTLADSIDVTATPEPVSTLLVGVSLAMFISRCFKRCLWRIDKTVRQPEFGKASTVPPPV